MTSVDQPALEDDVTARLFELSVQRVQGATLAPWCLLVTVGAVAMWVAITPVLAVAFGAVGLVGRGRRFATPCQVRCGGRRPRGGCSPTSRGARQP